MAAATVQSSGGISSRAAERRIGAVAGAFDRLDERQTGLAGTAPGSSLQQGVQLKELEDLVRDNKIAKRLAQLKASKT